MLYEQFQNLEDLLEFTRFCEIPSDQMVFQFHAAKEKNAICVFEFEDTPEFRKKLLVWRNR